MDIHSVPAEFQTVERSAWKRAEHFDFFSAFKEPFFSITAEVECTALIERCKASGVSATFPLWHGVLAVANSVEEFRYRIHDGEVVLFDRVHLSPTVLRPDKTFTITFVPYLAELERFCEVAEVAVGQAQKTTGFELSSGSRRVDLIHFSTVPWFKFTGLSHARYMDSGDSEPKIILGRYQEAGGR